VSPPPARAAEPVGPASEESFESATMVPRTSRVDGEFDPDGDDGDSLLPDDEALKAPPALDDFVAKIPGETKQLLEELFRARFRAVRRIRPDQLR
jgi:hypothetical protein